MRAGEWKKKREKRRKAMGREEGMSSGGFFRGFRAAVLVATALGVGLSSSGCDSDGGSGSSGNDNSNYSGVCGDGFCYLREGENEKLCPEDCDGAGGGGAEVRFFADFNSKAVEYGRTIRFTYVVWNQGSKTARNVVLPVPIVQNGQTEIFGDREYCGRPDSGYDCMVNVGYVPGSMRINRVYHPNRARSSYYFLDTVPITDAADGDEGFFDEDANVLYLTIPELRTRDDEPETAGVVWSYELVTDGGGVDTPCEEYPLVQNWSYVFADNAEEYFNDIIGHIFCESPRFHGEVSAGSSQVGAGESVELTLTMSYDDLVPPPGKEKSRFQLMRPRLYLNYPERLVTIESIGKPDEATDLPGFESEEEGGGVVYWARRDDNDDTNMQPGETETLTVTARIGENVPVGTIVDLKAKVFSQRTLPYQNVDGELSLEVTSGPDPSCGDGFCAGGAEDETSCPEDCPVCTQEDGVTSFGDPPCCEGLTPIRASHPYGWAYDQCYEWEGGGVLGVQSYCAACGDGECRGKENACNCPEDCGPHCTNWICEEGESAETCPADCS